MTEKRFDIRYPISFPSKIFWKNEEGDLIVSEGVTENIGNLGVLLHLPANLPNVGSKVK